MSNLVYHQRLQAEALSLVAAKTRASLMVEGELPEEGLAALDGDGGDVFLALARKLADPGSDLADERSLEALFAAARAATLEEDEVLANAWGGALNLAAADARASASPMLPEPTAAVAVPSLGQLVRFEQLAEALRRRQRHRWRAVAPEQLQLFAA